jgi:hypothetical protein
MSTTKTQNDNKTKTLHQVSRNRDEKSKNTKNSAMKIPKKFIFHQKIHS